MILWIKAVSVWLYLTNSLTHFKRELVLIKIYGEGFPGGAVVGNPPANAGDIGLSPGPGRSHMPRSNWAMHHNCWASALEPASHNWWACLLQLLKPVLLETVLHNRRGHRNERPLHRGKEWPLLATTRESLCAAMKTQCSQK